MMLKGVFSLTQKPDVQKLYTTTEIARLLNCPESQVRNIAAYYNIGFDKQINYKGARAHLYSYDSVRRIKERYEARLNKRKQKEITARLERTPQELAALQDHSLVKDKRCLNLDYWPDVVPECFKECEE